MKLADVSLDTLAGGALPEKFAHQLRLVLDNILDPNTEAEQKRSIEIKITFRPEDDRARVDADVDIRAKLAAPKGDTGQVYIGQREGEIVAVTYDPEQADFFNEETDVRPIERGRRGA